MAVLSKDALLKANDLEEREVDLPSIGGSVKIRALPAAYSSQASSEAMELFTTARGEQKARVNTARLEELQVFHALIEPKLNSVQEATQFMQQCGPAARKLIEQIDEISGVNKQALEEAQARFPASGEGPGNNGPAATDADSAGGQ
jgi:hypothetical protein